MDFVNPLNCDGCTLCCQQDTIILVPGDDPKLWKTEQVEGLTILAQREDTGSCVYLKKGGCGIWNQARPTMCRSFDCRKYALQREGRAPEGHPQQARLQRIIDHGLSKLRADGII